MQGQKGKCKDKKENARTTRKAIPWIAASKSSDQKSFYTQPLRIKYNLSYEHEHRKRRNCCYYSLPNGANIAWLYQSDDTSFELRGLMRYTSKAFTAWRPFNVGSR